MRWVRLALLFAVGLLACSGAGPATHAETLADALAAAYRNDPRLAAERARLRATDEELARAQSGYRPRITGNAALSSQRLETEPGSVTDGTTHPRSYSLELSQSLFDGYRTRSAVSEADANIIAGRHVLADAEQRIFLDVVAAFAGVLRDRQVVELRRANLKILVEELASTRSRLAAGDLTRTDVAQAESREARAKAELASAEAGLVASASAFELVAGHAPGRLVAPGRELPVMPSNLEEAIRTGLARHPLVGAARAREEAAGHAVQRITAGLMPRVDLQASYSGELDPNVLVERSETAIVSGRLTVPFYEGGEVSAQVRQAKELRVARAAELQREQLRVRSLVRSAWARLDAAHTQLVFTKTQIEAADLALTGVRQEARFGTRSLLDVLNAEQELLDAKIAMTGSDHELVTATYAVLAAIGALSAEDMQLATALYDPALHYDATDRKPFGTLTAEEESEWVASIAFEHPVAMSAAGVQANEGLSPLLVDPFAASPQSRVEPDR